MHAQEAQAAAQVLITNYESMRTEEKAQEFYDSVKTDKPEVVNNPGLPRYRKAPKRIDNGSKNHQFNIPEDYFRVQYYEVLEFLKADLERRFCQNTFNLISGIETYILAAANGRPFNFLQM